MLEARLEKEEGVGKMNLRLLVMIWLSNSGKNSFTIEGHCRSESSKSHGKMELQIEIIFDVEVIQGLSSLSACTQLCTPGVYGSRQPAKVRNSVQSNQSFVCSMSSAKRGNINEKILYTFN